MATEKKNGGMPPHKGNAFGSPLAPKKEETKPSKSGKEG